MEEILKVNKEIHRNKRNYLLDILKGAAILCILITHFHWTDSQRTELLFPFWVDMAVPVFMIVSGYVNACSSERGKIYTLQEAYQPKRLQKKLLRYLTPFAVTYLMEALLIVGFSKKINKWSILYQYTGGGYGPGSYYVPVMIQLVFLFPLIERIVRNYSFAGVVFCGAANLVYEFLNRLYGMSDSLNRMLVFRYTILIAYGCYLAVGKRKEKKWVSVLSFAIGTTFIIVTQYAGYKPIIFTFWTKTCCIAVLYIIPLIGAAVRSEWLQTFRFLPMEFLGKATYHIYLFQMVYYGLAAQRVYAVLPGTAAELAFSILFCLVGGVLFYLVETRISRRFIPFLMNVASKWSTEKVVENINVFLERKGKNDL